VTNAPHIIVIGAGLMGLCTADELTQRGARVTVIDGRSGPCEGTSFSNSGMIHPSQACSWDPDARQTQAALDAARVSVVLGKRSKTLLHEKMKQFGMAERDAGCIQLQPSLKAARTMQAFQNDLGVRTDVMMGMAESFGRPACFFPEDTSGDAQAFGCALEKNLAARDVRFIYDAEDLDLRRSDEGFAVRTSGHQFRCDHVVVAAGAGSPEILAKLGLRLHLELISGAAADFALPTDISDFPSCPIMDRETRSALTIFADRLRVSGGWNVTDPTPLIARWTKVAPHIFEQLDAPQSIWTSQRPVSPVGRPYISATSIPNLWVNTGHGHMGWTLCAGSGELLAEMILERRQDGRFAFAG
jgi:D-amino-acid dehydrogenase